MLGGGEEEERERINCQRPRGEKEDVKKEGRREEKRKRGESALEDGMRGDDEYQGGLEGGKRGKNERKGMKEGRAREGRKQRKEEERRR